MIGLNSRLVAGLVAAAAGLALSSAAHASLASNVTVTLSAPGGFPGDPTPITAVQVATPADGITAGDGGDIGSGWMLDGEEIVFVGNSIHIHVAAGAENDSGKFISGYLGDGANHALYDFSGLDITGEQIVGFVAYAFDGYATSGETGLESPTDPTEYVHLLSPSRLSFDLDTFIFKDRGFGGASNYAEFRIDLVTRTTQPPGPVPEPPMLALALTSLGLLWAARRRTAATGAR